MDATTSPEWTDDFLPAHPKTVSWKREHGWGPVPPSAASGQPGASTSTRMDWAGNTVLPGSQTTTQYHASKMTSVPSWVAKSQAIASQMHQARAPPGSWIEGQRQPAHATLLPKGRVNFPQPGIPLPDPQALGSNEHMDAAAYRMEKMLYANFDPQRHVVMIEGRPTCCIIVSHNRPPPHECDPYMLTALRPLRPLILLGVSARTSMAPKMQRKFSVTHWWKVCMFLFRW